MPDWKPKITKQLAALNLAPEREAEIIEEIAQHLQERFEELITSGTSECEARDLVLAELQDDHLLARELRNVEAPSPLNTLVLGAEKAGPMDNLGRDLQYGLRMLIKNRGFTAVAAATLALGIGANTFIFTVMNKFLLRPLPVEDPSRIVSLNTASADGGEMPIFSYANYR